MLIHKALKNPIFIGQMKITKKKIFINFGYPNTQTNTLLDGSYNETRFDDHYFPPFVKKKCYITTGV